MEPVPEPGSRDGEVDVPFLVCLRWLEAVLPSASRSSGMDPMPSVTSAVQERRAASDDRRWLVLVIVAIAQLMVVLDSTIVNIALPSAQRALGFPNSDRQWVVTAYALA